MCNVHAYIYYVFFFFFVGFKLELCHVKNKIMQTLLGYVKII